MPCTDEGFCIPFEGAGFSCINSYCVNAEDRGYLVGSLNTILEKGKRYSVSYYVKKTPCSGYEVDLLGISFADRKSIFKYAYRNSHPDLSCLNNIRIYVEEKLKANSYDEWKLVSGEFIAAGGEEKIIIGCFRKDTELTVTKNKPDNKTNSCGCKNLISSKLNALAFIDAVSVELIE